MIAASGDTIFGVGVAVDHSVVTANGDRPLFDGDVRFSHSVVPISPVIEGIGNVRTDHPGLGDLEDNGGFAPTMIPLSASRVLDAGDADIGGTPATDQRGEARIAGHAVDIGAVEVQPVTQHGQLKRAVRMALLD